MAFPRFLILGMHIGRTHLQSGQPFHMHPDNDYNMGYLQPPPPSGITVNTEKIEAQCVSAD